MPGQARLVLLVLYIQTCSQGFYHHPVIFQNLERMEHVLNCYLLELFGLKVEFLNNLFISLLFSFESDSINLSYNDILTYGFGVHVDGGRELAFDWFKEFFTLLKQFDFYLLKTDVVFNNFFELGGSLPYAFNLFNLDFKSADRFFYTKSSWLELP